ncbi:MAG: WYL domain-containing protein [Lachnospiraceae bacterium]|nr:WYL domain-containing protein [Lachnospiraceae bacterium]
MDFFHEIYSAYFQVVRKILLDAAKTPVTASRMEEISRTYAFEESFLTILPKLLSGPWSPLLSPKDGHSYGCALSFASQASEAFLKPPLTNLQKAWLKALLLDDRFRLFFSQEELLLLEEELSMVKPLYLPTDFHYFDQYADKDPYTSPTYQEHFQMVEKALGCSPLSVVYEGAKAQGSFQTLELLPCRLQYSPKDDKFRLLAVSLHQGHSKRAYVLNMSRIVTCQVSTSRVPKGFDWDFSSWQQQAPEPVCIRIRQQRNALERCMLHFASYEKKTIYEPETDTYLCSINYDLADETELLIQLLSFGPVIEILGPEPFLKQVRQRVIRQHHLFYAPL